MRKYVRCKYHTVAHFFQRDDDTREFIQWKFKEEEKKRKVAFPERDIFFHFRRNGSNKCEERSHSIVSELFMGVNKARIGINYDNIGDRI